MKRNRLFTTVLLIATLGTTIASNPSATELRKSVRHSQTMPQKSIRTVFRSPEKEIIITPPEGENILMVKSGTGYGCDGVANAWKQPADGTLVNTVRTADGKFYMNSVFSQVIPEESGIIDYGGMPCDFSFDYGYLEGTVNDGYVEFTFPQYVQRIVWDFDMGSGLGDEYIYTYDYYALALQPDEEGKDYVPCENQVYRLKIEEDGSLKAEHPEFMIGQCVRFDDTEEVTFSWQLNGDTDISLSPQTAVMEDIPANLEYSGWNLINEYSSRTLQLAFTDDCCYIKGLCTGKDMEDAVVKGYIDKENNNVILRSGQFIGNYYAEMTEAWFMTALEKESGFDYTDELTLQFDAEKNVYTAPGYGLYFTTTPKGELYFQHIENPYLSKPTGNEVITELQTPVITAFYEADDEYDAEIYFIIPTIDVDKNILDTEKLSYVIALGVDEESVDNLCFYQDEYLDLPQEMNGTDRIPFGFSTSYDFGFDGVNEHHLMIYARDFKILGVAAVYQDGENTIKSKFAYPKGFGTSYVGMLKDEGIKEVRYYDSLGRPVSKECKGLIIKQIIKTDNSSESIRIINR